jgi:membrane glycosyltransferase
MNFPDAAFVSPAKSSNPDHAAASFHAPLPLLRRFVFFSFVAFTIGWGIGTMFHILSANGTSIVEAGLLVLFGLTFGWIAVSFWTAVAGFLLKLLRIDPLTLRPVSRLRAEELKTGITTRTAVVMPVFNEDPARVFAGLEATYRSLEPTGEIKAFDFYVLSDTRDPRIAAAEQLGWATLCRRLGANGRLFYRRRPDNAGRKAGNIADFCRRWGPHYEHMIVLDADSVMAGETMVTLVRAMQAAPQAGIIQTVPLPARQVTAFGRFVQFAARLYSPMLANGLSFWQMGECNYWGHNAILRVSAFTRHCGLPLLPGKPPLGGEILSHDFVEAAFLSRAGWKVYLLPNLGGSYEEVPNNILDFAKRDRRWVQGNLQHLKLLSLIGLHPLNRLHFLLGALAYVSSLIWLMLLALGTVDALTRALTPTDFFGLGYQLFPDWTIVDREQILSLLGVTAGMLLLPKLFGTLLATLEPAVWRSFGKARLLLGASAEVVFSVILAPVMMTLHAYFVASVLAGRKVNWDPQNRGPSGLSVADSARALIAPTLLGAAWGTVTYAISPQFFWWLSPVILGLVVAVPLCAWSSHVRPGEILRRLGVFATPEEIDAPEEIRLVDDRLARAGRSSPQPFGITTPPMAHPSEILRDMSAQPLRRWSLVRYLTNRRPSDLWT